MNNLLLETSFFHKNILDKSVIHKSINISQKFNTPKWKSLDFKYKFKINRYRTLFVFSCGPSAAT